jgi:hypothetical protein
MKIYIYIQRLNNQSTINLAGSDKIYQLLAQGRWFSPCTLASSTTKTACHDIVEILLKVALKHQKINQSYGVLDPYGITILYK